MKNMFRVLSLALVLCLMTVGCSFAEDTDMADGELYVEDEEIIVDELVDVDSLMINNELDDEGWWNILLLGADSRSTDNYYGLSDSMMILSINPATNEAKLTSLMRDTWVNIFGVGEGKLNAANVYGGPELAMRTVNEHFGMNITQYVLVNMHSLIDIIDQMGGVEVTIDASEMNAINKQMEYDVYDFTTSGATKVTSYGENTTLTGRQALTYARIRSIDNDYIRTQRQRNVLVAIAKKLQDVDTGTLLSVVMTLAGYVDTNLSLTQIASLAKVGLAIDIEGIQQLRLPADGTFNSGNYNGTWCIRPNFETNTQLLHDFIYGEGTAEYAE